MQLFYAPDIVPPLHTLNEEESKHCIRVLRLQCGGRIHITDGRGNLFCCEITDDNPRRCTVRVVSAETGFEKLPYALTMAVAPRWDSTPSRAVCWRRPTAVSCAPERCSTPSGRRV